MRHLMSPLDFSVEELDKLLDTCAVILRHILTNTHMPATERNLATLFYEPSTRTRLSHEAAMLNLGGSVMGFSSARIQFCFKRRNVYLIRSARSPATQTSVQ